MLDNSTVGHLPKPYPWQLSSFLAPKLAKLEIIVPYTAQSTLAQLCGAAAQITEAGSNSTRTSRFEYDFYANAFAIDIESTPSWKVSLAQGMSESNNRIDPAILEKAQGAFSECRAILDQSTAEFKIQIATEWWRQADKTRDGRKDIAQVQHMLGEQYPLIGLMGKEEALTLGLSACRWFDKPDRRHRFHPGTLIAIGGGSLELISFVRPNDKEDHETRIDYNSCTAISAGKAPLLANTGGDPAKVQEFINKKLKKSNWKSIKNETLYVTSSGLTTACKLMKLLTKDEKHKIDTIDLEDKEINGRMSGRLSFAVAGDFSYLGDRKPPHGDDIIIARYACAVLQTIYELTTPKRIILVPTHDCNPRMGAMIDLGLA